MAFQTAEVEQTIPYLNNQDSGTSDLIKWQITGDDIADNIELQLKGFQWDSIEKKYKKKQKQILSDDGVAEVKTILTSNLGKGPILCYFSNEKEIRLICADVWQQLADKLYMKWKEWKVEKQNLSMIRMIVVNAIFFSLKKGLMGKYIELLKPTMKRTENIVTPNGGGRGGFLNFINPFK